MNGTMNVLIGGQERPIYFGTNQSRKYCEVRGVSLAEMRRELAAFVDVKDEDGRVVVESQSNGGDVVDLVYSALWAGAM